ncbi:MAG: prolipoprotein diacylglyceryl transferase [Clostridiales bacterium]|nr:prolipoprotein diacylglyceryl transferase [Clostridiales bacterium]
MNPVAFEIFGISIRWYGILIGCGMLIGAYIAMKEAKRQGFEEETLLDILIIALPCAIIGARLYYVLFNLNAYDTIWEALNIRSGGLAIHGGVLAAVGSFAIYSKIKKMEFWKWLDIAAPSLILGQAIGRWGNFINQEAHGGPTDLPWGIVVDGMKVHPTFLYESLANFIIFFILFKMRKTKKFDGQQIAWYMILYSIIRFFIEGLRTDSLYLGEFRVAQLISLVLIGLGILLLYIRGKKKDEFIPVE